MKTLNEVSDKLEEVIQKIYTDEDYDADDIIKELVRCRDVLDKFNTWISVKDALPPKKIPKNKMLIGMYYDIYVSRIRRNGNILEPAEGIFFTDDPQPDYWMLLSKPTNT